MSAPPTASLVGASPRAVFDQFDSRVDIYSGSSGGGSDSVRLSSGYLCLKVLLMAANLVTLIFGIVLLAVASYALTSQINALTGVTLPAGIICLGVFVLVLSLCGAAAVWHESRVGLLLYALALLAIVISLFALAIAVYVKKDQAASYISSGWQYAPSDARQALEVEFACCGLSSFPANATAACPSPSLVIIPQNQTCLPLFVAAFQSNYSTAGGCGIAFAVLMGCWVALAVLLVRGITVKRARAAEKEDSRRASRAAMEMTHGQQHYEGADTDDYEDEDDDEDDEDEEGEEGEEDDEQTEDSSSNDGGGGDTQR